MIDRYSMPEMAAVFSDTTRFGRYLEIELLATEAQARLGVVPAGDDRPFPGDAPLGSDLPEGIRFLGREPGVVPGWRPGDRRP